MMQTSVIIPVWNGAPVIGECLEAVYAHSGGHLLEVICVDNASPDNAAQLIAARFPDVRLIRQPINLGFAGGVNAGMRAARGDEFVLLNQDCLVQPGWLGALLDALNAQPEFGIAGCTIFNADGSINHAGAQLRRSDALGIHFTDRPGDQPRPVDYVTGAAMAIRRRVWDTIGQLDDGFYPAYYEEVDYCYRARHAGFEVVHAPQAQVRHLFSSREWQADPIKHWTIHQRNRYRFVSKHFSEAEFLTFVDTDLTALQADPSIDMLLARTLGARETLRCLPEIAHRRRIDLGLELTSEQQHAQQIGFTRILRQAFAAAEKLARTNDGYFPDRWRQSETAAGAAGQVALQQLQAIEQREQDVLYRAFFLPRGGGSKPPWQRLLLRLLSIVSGREHRLLTELNVLHAQRFEALEQLLGRERFARDLIDRRLALLEILTDYDYR
jgi:GT2 family glycosyltransferase